VPKEIRVAPEIPDGGKSAPPDRVTGLSAPERSPAGIGDDHADIVACDLFYILSAFVSCCHRVRGQKDHHAIIDIALVYARPHTDMPKRELGEDERVLHDDIG
jgi:hypothetical protein